jgi:hypothetical protein
MDAAKLAVLQAKTKLTHYPWALGDDPEDYQLRCHIASTPHSGKS